MGSYCEIARRLSDRHVQHGCGGCDGYYRSVGWMLWHKYNSPDMVEYLFSLGQLDLLWLPPNESKDSYYQTKPRNYPHWVDNTERKIFSRVMFLCCGYLYDTDNVWYYVTSGPFRVKIPLALVAANLDEEGKEFSFISQVEHRVLDEIFSGQYVDKLEHCIGTGDELQRIYQKLSGEEVEPLYLLWERYKSIYDCLDDWVVVRADVSGKKIGEIILKPDMEQHTETIFW